MVFDFAQYQVAARKTATYPKEYGRQYVRLGLKGEAGEVADKLKKLIRDDAWVPGSPVPEDKRMAIVKELGDVLWYVANHAYEYGVEITGVKIIGLNNTDLCAPVEDLAEACSKRFNVDHEFIILLIAWCAKILGYTIDDVARINTEKLADRQRRDKLNGSGDDR